MDENFKILLQAVLDKVASKKGINDDITNLQNQVDNIKIKAELDPNTANKLASDIAKLLNRQITLSNININQRQLSQTAQQAGKIMSKELKEALQDVTPPGIDVEYSLNEDATDRLDKEVKKKIAEIESRYKDGVAIKVKYDVQNAQNPILDDENKPTGDYAYMQKLAGATFEIKTATGETITQYMKWKEIGKEVIEGQDASIMGLVETHRTYNTVIEDSIAKTSTFVDKRKAAFQKLSDSTAKLAAGAIDPNANKPIKNEQNLEEIAQQYQRVKDALDALDNATETTFNDAKSAVESEKNALEMLITALRNAESTAESLREKPIDVVKETTVQRLKGLESEIEKAGVSSKTLGDNIQDAYGILEQDNLDRSGINNALNLFEKARAELGALKKEASAKISLEIAQVKADGLRSEITNLTNANAELSKFEAKVGNAKVSVASLLSALGNVSTSDDVKLITRQWEAFTASARAAGKITNETVISEKQLQRFYAEKARILQNIKTYLKENSKLTRDTSANAKELKQQFEAAAAAIENLGKGDTVGLSTINKQVTTLKSRVRELGLEGRSLGHEISNMFSKFSGWFSVSQAVMLFISKVKEADEEIKELDTTLTEIGKTSDLAGDALKALGDRAFETASKYGKVANDYLLGVQEMSRAGYENMEQMAELSTLVQSAGDLTAELANDYIIAADAAYGYKGNVEKLTSLLDAQNQVTNRNAVSMEELANATKTAGSLLANVANLSEQEMTAILGAGIASSRESGETVARAVRSIMMNLQGVAGEGGFDGEIIDEDALAKVEARCRCQVT